MVKDRRIAVEQRTRQAGAESGSQNKPSSGFPLVSVVATCALAITLMATALIAWGIHTQVLMQAGLAPKEVYMPSYQQYVPPVLACYMDGSKRWFVCMDAACAHFCLISLQHVHAGVGTRHTHTNSCMAPPSSGSTR